MGFSILVSILLVGTMAYAQGPNGFQEFERGSVNRESLVEAESLVNETYMMAIKRSVDKNCDNSGNCAIATNAG